MDRARDLKSFKTTLRHFVNDLMIWEFFPANDFSRLNANNFYSFCLLGSLWSSLMNPENPPPYSGPGPTAPYPPYPQQPPYPPQPMGPMGGPYPPPQGYPYPGYPQYGWQGGPQQPPKTTGGWLNMWCACMQCHITKENDCIFSLVEKELAFMTCGWCLMVMTEGASHSRGPAPFFFLNVPCPL